MAEPPAQLRLTQIHIAYSTPMPARQAMLLELLSGATVNANDVECEVCVVAQEAAE